jgi:hypothetical protein
LAIYSGSQTIGTVATQIDGASVHSVHIHIRNNDNTKTLYIGNSNVSVGNGLLVDGGATIDFDLPPNEHLFMVSSSGNHTVSWLKIEVV